MGFSPKVNELAMTKFNTRHPLDRLDAHFFVASDIAFQSPEMKIENIKHRKGPVGFTNNKISK